MTTCWWFSVVGISLHQLSFLHSKYYQNDPCPQLPSPLSQSPTLLCYPKFLTKHSDQCVCPFSFGYFNLSAFTIEADDRKKRKLQPIIKCAQRRKGWEFCLSLNKLGADKNAISYFIAKRNTYLNLIMSKTWVKCAANTEGESKHTNCISISSEETSKWNQSFSLLSSNRTPVNVGISFYFTSWVSVEQVQFSKYKTNNSTEIRGI